MKNFVSMNVINKVFNDMDSVDYITIADVTDSTLVLNIFLTKMSVPKRESDLSKEFIERCKFLEIIVERTVQYNLIPSKISDVFSRLLVGRKKEKTS